MVAVPRERDAVLLREREHARQDARELLRDLRERDLAPDHQRGLGNERATSDGNRRGHGSPFELHVMEPDAWPDLADDGCVTQHDRAHPGARQPPCAIRAR
jgi:hypothetical protein